MESIIELWVPIYVYIFGRLAPLKICLINYQYRHGCTDNCNSITLVSLTNHQAKHSTSYCPTPDYVVTPHSLNPSGNRWKKRQISILLGYSARLFSDSEQQ